MSIIDGSTVDFIHQRGGGNGGIAVVTPDHQRLSSKRKLDDYSPGFEDDDEEYADFSDLVSVRMRKDEPKAVNSLPDSNSNSENGSMSEIDARVSDAQSAAGYACSSRSESTRSLMRLQFFIRMMSEGNTMVIQAYPQDTVRSIHERIQTIKGIPVFEQRLIYRGKQLQWEQTLADCSIQNDANLQLVGRMRSTEHPQAWQVINDMVSLVWRLCRGEVEHDASKTLRALMTNYLNESPRVDNDSATGYFQIFISSSAPAVLVMLYMSPYRGNKDIADCSIRHFLSSCRTTLPKQLHSHCARVVLELCKLLRRVGSDDPLYLYCRSTFGSLLETAGVSYGSESGQGLVLIQEIFPFVRELADRLMMDLDLSMKSTSSVGPLLSDVRDFAAFLLALRTGITEHRAFKAPFSSLNDEKHDNNLLPPEEIECLRLIFIELLKKMHQCLQKVEDFLTVKGGGDSDLFYPSAWSQYLSILKELHHISKLYEGAEGEFLSVLRQQKGVVCLLIIQYAKRIDDHQWILEHKDVTDFVSRRHLAMMMFPEVKEDYEELHEMLIDRSQLLAESFAYISQAEAESLHGGLFMEFKNEEATGPGVLREWFLLVCQELFNPQHALFLACPNDRRRFFPNPASKVHPQHHLDYFIFAGRVIGLALMHKIQVGIVFDRVFFLQLAGKYISLEDIQDADPYMYNSCKQILEMDAGFIDSDALGLTFVREVEELGSRKVIELCPGGKSIVVNSKNRDEYVDLVIKDRFVTSVSDQVLHFARGFGDILCNSRLQQFFFQSLELEDFDWMLHGSENTISVEDWRAHTEYNGYKESDPQISWFWETVGGMSAEQKKVLLFFWTSIKYLPVEGFRGLASRLYIYKTPEPDVHLPSSHTCFYRLCFPPYPSLAIMQDRLGVITQEHIGCSFGTW